MFFSELSGVILFENNVFNGNLAVQSPLNFGSFGGVLFMIGSQTSQFFITNCSFASNYAEFGGGLFVSFTTGLIYKSQFMNNSAVSAGSIYSDLQAELYLIDISFCDEMAEDSGKFVHIIF